MESVLLENPLNISAKTLKTLSNNVKEFRKLVDSAEGQLTYEEAAISAPACDPTTTQQAYNRDIASHINPKSLLASIILQDKNEKNTLSITKVYTNDLIMRQIISSVTNVNDLMTVELSSPRLRMLSRTSPWCCNTLLANHRQSVALPNPPSPHLRLANLKNMVRRRSASPRPSPPVRSAARPSPPPAQTLPARTAAPMGAAPMGAAPMGGPTANPIPGARQPGLMAQMAATAGGVAIGSAVGHTVGNMLTGGGGRSEVAEAPAAAPAGAPQGQAYANPCEFEWKQFIECTQNQSDVSLCQGFNEAFKQCKAHYVQQQMMTTVGFIGLGNMGAHMARNLMKNGHKLVVYDINKKVVDSFKADGAEAAACPAEVAAASSDIITMLPSSPHVRKAYGGDDGLLKQMQPGTLCIDSSTIDQTASLEVAEWCKTKQSTYLDAPVSGGVTGAQNATLTFMVGSGKCQKTFDRAARLIKCMGKNMVNCGEVGAGQAAKICNNMLLAIEMAGVAETMNLGIKMGLDPKVLAGIINTSSGRCWSSDTYNPVPGVIEGIPPSNGYQGGFGSALMAKDLSLAQNAATTTQSPTPLGSLAHQIYRLLAQDPKYSAKDFGIVYQFIKSQN
ncbi:unnamed protein product [Cylicocyclus nassatus]|uniref:3-hydroxyisobutyrate dehydrogenase n=1 Tax=Cylicocyclus nassatus TaxID=53992 RepID=A0AA36GWY6_CYLNA|nr:unnamed protein product [Cylicocyclus nassatus]